MSLGDEYDPMAPNRVTLPYNNEAERALKTVAFGAVRPRTFEVDVDGVPK